MSLKLFFLGNKLRVMLTSVLGALVKEIKSSNFALDLKLF